MKIGLMNTDVTAFHLGEILEFVFLEPFYVESTSSIQFLQIEDILKYPAK